MEDKTFNGWNNYNTWKLALNIMNTNKSTTDLFYNEFKNGISFNDFMDKAIKRNDRYVDKDISYNEVDFKEIYDYLMEYWEC